MKHTVRLLFCASLIFIFNFSIFNLSAQELPQGYFRNPLGTDIGLSATFAEFRANHFHAGIDMRTGGLVDQPVYAAADGYVARVSISPWGGGKILYIKHPNGYTSVYMHLNGYAGAIGKAVLREQYARQNYSISKIFGPNELPIKKGQLVAFSGNTGGSGGPHLHFEIRRGGAADLHTHSTTINPLLFGLPYRDSMKPVIRGLRIYPLDSDGFEVDKDNTATLNGPFYLGIYATDAAEGSTPKNGPDRVEVYLDGTLCFMYTTTQLPIDSSRMVNALIDHPHFARTRQAYLLTRALPGAEGPWIPVRMGDGVFRLNPGTTHYIGIKVFDIKENCTERILTVRIAENAKKNPPTSALLPPSSDLVKYDQPFSYQLPTINCQLNPYTLYADDRLAISANGQTATILPTLNNIPPHLAYSLGIRGALPGVPAEKTVVVHVTRKPGSVKLSAYKTTHTSEPRTSNSEFRTPNSELHTAQVREWGEFTLAADTTPPLVRPLNFSDGKPLKANTLKIKISDDLAGIETYNCYLNDQWILAEYDGKTATLFIDTRGKLRSGRNNLRVVVTDATGNVTQQAYSLQK